MKRVFVAVAVGFVLTAFGVGVGFPAGYVANSDGPRKVLPFEQKAIDFFEGIQAGDLKKTCATTSPDLWLANFILPADCAQAISQSVLASGPLEYRILDAHYTGTNGGIVTVQFRISKGQWATVVLRFALDRANYTTIDEWLDWQQKKPGPDQGPMKWRLYVLS